MCNKGWEVTTQNEIGYYTCEEEGDCVGVKVRGSKIRTEKNGREKFREIEVDGEKKSER